MLEVLDVTDWPTEGDIDHYDRFKVALQEEGIPPDVITALLPDYDEAREPLSRIGYPPDVHTDTDPKTDFYLGLARRETVNRVRDLLVRRLTPRLLEGPHVQAFLVPVFVLSAPRIEGTRVTYKETLEDQQSGCWELKLAGSGLSQRAIASFGYESEVECRAGDSKLIVATIPVRTMKVGYFFAGKQVAEHSRVEFVKTPQRKAPTTTPRLLTKRELKALQRKAFSSETIDLRRDRRGDVSRTNYWWKAERTVNGSLSVPGLTAQAAIRVSVVNTRNVNIGYELIGGHRYVVYEPQGQHGILWG